MMELNKGDIVIVNLYPKKGDDLKENTDILVNQVRTLSKVRIKKKISKISNEEFELIIQALCKNFQ